MLYTEEAPGVSKRMRIPEQLVGQLSLVHLKTEAGTSNPPGAKKKISISRALSVSTADRGTAQGGNRCEATFK